ncbi:MAG: CSLREA domain-containing protein [Bryobacteraceae bacterium]|nr:CSLREA domain-containing protein [Bryobacteraceae bacterium]
MKTATTIVQFAVLAALCGGNSPAAAATFTVNSFADAGDSNPGNGICSAGRAGCTLRAAIEEANALPSAPFDPDIILVPGGLYPLSLGALKITDHLRIIGAREGEATVVDGQQLDSVFVVDGGRTRIGVEMHFLTIRNGRAPDQYGGGVSNDMGNLLIHRSRVQLNTGFSGGGGIYNRDGSIVALSRSWVFNNGVAGDSSAEPQRGGGLYNAGAAFVDQSTISNNVAGRGGAIYQPAGGYLIVRNSTISYNTGHVETGGVMASGTAYLNNATIVYNRGVPETLPNGPPQATATGGLYGGGNTFVANTIVAHNTLGPDGMYVERHDCAGTITGAGYNLVLDPAGCTLAGDVTGNVLGQDPLLGSSAFNGGDSPNFSLLPGSPAINAGNPAFPNGIGAACEPTDQRFMLRGIGPGVGRCDIGAYERGGAPGEEAAP